MPGVVAVGQADIVPMSGSGWNQKVLVNAQLQEEICWFNRVSPGYFKAMGIPILQGRAFTEREDERAPWAVVINRTMANKVWPGESPLGKRFTFDDPGQPDTKWLTVVGVVGEVYIGGIGVGRGYQPREVEVFGFPYGSSIQDQERNRAFFEEAYDILIKCWTQESFSHHGEFFTIPPSYTRWNHKQTIAYFKEPGNGRALEDVIAIGGPDMYSAGSPVLATTTKLLELQVAHAHAAGVGVEP